MKRVFKYLGNYKKLLSFSLTIKVLGTVTELFLPYILTHIIKHIIPLKRVDYIIYWGLLMVLAAFICVTFNIYSNKISAYIANNVTKRIRKELFYQIENLSCEQVDKFTTPSLVSRLTTDTYNLHNLVGNVQRMGIRAPVLLIGGMIMTLTLDPVLTLVLFGTLPFIITITFIVEKKGMPLYQNIQKSVDKVVKKVRENATGVRVIKSLGREEYEQKEFAKVNQENVNKEIKASYTMSFISPAISLVLNFGLTLVVLIAAYRVDDNLTDPANLVAFLSYFMLILNGILMITRFFITFSRASASGQRIEEIMALNPNFSLKEIDVVRNDSIIEFENVCFSYDKVKNNLNNVSFKIKQNESLGIIGATGSGKSTIINLLMKFYLPDSGKIFIDGHNILSLDEKELRHNFGVVFQNDVIFMDSIENNITFGRKVTEQNILKAIETAQAKDFIDVKNHGLKKELTLKGNNLSGGQKQRVLLARALVNSPKVLILDDSSSALDYRTDMNFRLALNKNYPELSKIIVAQRISSIKDCTHILILDKGNVVGYGTHSELMTSNAEYKEIYLSQMGGDFDAH